MITRKTFIESIKNIRKRIELETQLHDIIRKLEELRDMDSHIQSLAEDLELPTNTVIGNDIAYYCFERQFDGSSAPFATVVKGKRKKKIYIKNAGELYDFLTRKGKK